MTPMAKRKLRSVANDPVRERVRRADRIVAATPDAVRQEATSRTAIKALRAAFQAESAESDHPAWRDLELLITFLETLARFEAPHRDDAALLARLKLKLAGHRSDLLEACEKESITTVVCNLLSKTAAGGGQSAAALVVEATGLPEPVPEDRDRNGRQRATGVGMAGMWSDQPTVTYVNDRDEPELPSPGPLGDDSLPFEEAAAPLLRLVDAAGIAGLKPGRGARLDKRILIYSLLSMPQKHRHPRGLYQLVRPLRWWIGLLYPSTSVSPTSYRPSQDGPRILTAMRSLVYATVRLPDGTDWLPATPRQFPRFDDLDSPVRVDLALPDECDHGPQLSWPRLLRAGVDSDPAFDAVLGLAYLWDRAKAQNGGHRIYATRPRARRNTDGVLLNAQGAVITARPGSPYKRGRGLSWPPGNTPVTDWRHPETVINGTEPHPQAHRVPPLTREARRQLAFPAQTSKASEKRYPHQIRSNERRRADELLSAMEARGEVEIRRDPIGVWRILEVAPASEQRNSRSSRRPARSGPSALPGVV